MAAKERPAGTNEEIRTFICIEIPQSVRKLIGELQSTLKQIGAQVSWVKPDNIHLTLKFLGDVEAGSIEKVIRASERATGFRNQFHVEVGGAGCFPSPRHPKVLWVGLVNLPDQLRNLHEAIESELEREGFPREGKSFKPHLTIGRVRAAQGASRVAEELIQTAFPSTAFPVRELIVMRSQLNPAGSVYTPLAVIPLADRSA
ncbi:MAG TPA: RNA 2',3'-cyclic phosphodiesterase [Blastocatellia bacterium]|jgi:2'-5' RNA ligase|nr:RNA 2',3'-cyclic phosphodiesterase [Blastocatellia bacterium]